MEITQAVDYRRYLRSWLDDEKPNRRNIKTQLAEHIGCKLSYLSQVLGERANFTLEQSILINEFFGHTNFESRLFILMVERERAGSKKLEDHFKQQIASLLKEQNLKKRFELTGQVPDETQQLYYSAWYFSAIHMLLATPEINSQTIAARLNLPVEEVNRVIEVLLESGLVSRKGSSYEFAQDRVYLGRDAVSIKHHHINWRSQALQSVEKNLPTDLHYSTVTAISRDDFERIKSVLMQAIDRSREITGPSKEEDVYALTIDWFKV